MGLWDHITPQQMTRNYGLAGGWLTPPKPPVDPMTRTLQQIHELPEKT